MKRYSLFRKAFFVLMFISAAPLFAAQEEIIIPYDLHQAIHDIEKPTAPVVTDEYIIFTADTNHRFVGIAFDFENYQTIHPFKLLNSLDEDGNKTPKHLFYCYERTHKISQIKYRLVIDGLWTTDPLNPNRFYDDSVNLYFSVVTAPGLIAKNTEVTKSDCVHFIYKGEPGLDLHLAGTFSNWDPWIYTLTETSPGFYELELPLPTGKYYYNYYIGLTPILDDTNPQKAYTSDGRSMSVIQVN